MSPLSNGHLFIHYRKATFLQRLLIILIAPDLDDLCYMAVLASSHDVRDASYFPLNPKGTTIANKKEP